MKKKIILLFALLLVLAGCTQQDYIVQLYDNGNVNFRATVTFPKEMLEQADRYDIDRKEEIKKDPSILFEEFNKVASLHDFEIKEFNDQILYGYSYTKKYKTIKDFNKDMDQMYKDGLIGLQLEIDNKARLVKKEYRIKGNLSYHLDPSTRELFENINNISTVIDVESLGASLSFIAPYGIKGQKNGSVDGTTVSYSVPFSVEEDNGKQIAIITDREAVKARMFFGLGAVVVVGFAVVYGLRVYKAQQRRR